MKKVLYLLSMLLGSLLCLPAQAGQPPLTDQRNLIFSVFNKTYYDSNLFRLASERSVEDAGGVNIGDREDYVNQASLAGAARLFAGRQTFDFIARLDDNRFKYNDMLDYKGGSGAATWNWSVGNDWAGKSGVEKKRSLASFENNKLLKKDLLTRTDYFYDFRNFLTPRWSWAGGVRRSDVTHSANEHDADNAQLNNAKLGVSYDTPRSDAIGADYLLSEGWFPERENLGLRKEDYRQGRSDFWLKYAPTAKTNFDAHVGYLQRDYDDVAFDDFSGGTGRVKWQWLPTIKTQFGISVWRELLAYIDAESDYYVSRGVKVSPVWQPSDVLQFLLEFSSEQQDFVGANLLPGEPGRHDTVHSKQVSLVYSPNEIFELDLSYRDARRNSNRTLLDYEDKIVALELTFNL